jgi:hypothetical protein
VTGDNVGTRDPRSRSHKAELNASREGTCRSGLWTPMYYLEMIRGSGENGEQVSNGTGRRIAGIVSD